MTQFRMLLILLAALIAGAPARASLDAVAEHLRATRTMTADFVQTAGSEVRRGKFVLERPGKVRFQFDPPLQLLIIGDGKTLSLVDYEVSQVSTWPIRSTPLSVLLDPSELGRYARELPRTGDKAPLLIEARDPKHPEYGVLTMAFARDAEAPGGLRLSGWQVLDAQGQTTRVVLSGIRFNVPVAPSSFTYRDPRGRRAPGRG